MIEFIYNTLAALGYTHPLHPAATHIPMGMVMGAFIFILASRKWETLVKPAFYCLCLALLFAPITVLLGFMDWQHRLYGKMSGLIIAKFVLAGLLIAVLAITVYLENRGLNNKKIRLVLYAACFFTGIALGAIGGELAYG